MVLSEYEYEEPGLRSSAHRVGTPNVVLFGPADFGKSTVIGKIFAVARGIDTGKFEEDLKGRLGT